MAKANKNKDVAINVEDIDFSVIRTAIEAGGKMIDQILNGVHYGSPEIRLLLRDECDIILECCVCRALFRSLPNFVAHKRVYCPQAFSYHSRDHHTFMTGFPSPKGQDIIVIEPTAPKEPISSVETTQDLKKKTGKNGEEGTKGNKSTGEEGSKRNKSAVQVEPAERKLRSKSNSSEDGEGKTSGSNSSEGSRVLREQGLTSSTSSNTSSTDTQKSSAGKVDNFGSLAETVRQIEAGTLGNSPAYLLYSAAAEKMEREKTQEKPADIHLAPIASNPNAVFVSTGEKGQAFLVEEGMDTSSENAQDVLMEAASNSGPGQMVTEQGLKPYSIITNRRVAMSRSSLRNVSRVVRELKRNKEEKTHKVVAQTSQQNSRPSRLTPKTGSQSAPSAVPSATDSVRKTSSRTSESGTTSAVATKTSSQMPDEFRRTSHTAETPSGAVPARTLRTGEGKQWGDHSDSQSTSSSPKEENIPPVKPHGHTRGHGTQAVVKRCLTGHLGAVRTSPLKHYMADKEGGSGSGNGEGCHGDDDDREGVSGLGPRELGKTAYDSAMDMDNIRCRICKMGFAQRRSLVYHCRTRHSGQRTIFPCPYCPRVFYYLWGLTRHLNTNHKKSHSEIERMRKKLRQKAYKQEFREPAQERQSPSVSNDIRRDSVRESGATSRARPSIPAWKLLSNLGTNTHVSPASDTHEGRRLVSPFSPAVTRSAMNSHFITPTASSSAKKESQNIYRKTYLSQGRLGRSTSESSNPEKPVTSPATPAGVRTIERQRRSTANPRYSRPLESKEVRKPHGSTESGELENEVTNSSPGTSQTIVGEQQSPITPETGGGGLYMESGDREKQCLKSDHAGGGVLGPESSPATSAWSGMMPADVEPIMNKTPVGPTATEHHSHGHKFISPSPPYDSVMPTAREQIKKRVSDRPGRPQTRIRNAQSAFTTSDVAQVAAPSSSSDHDISALHICPHCQRAFGRKISLDSHVKICRKAPATPVQTQKKNVMEVNKLDSRRTIAGKTPGPLTGDGVQSQQEGENDSQQGQAGSSAVIMSQKTPSLKTNSQEATTPESGRMQKSSQKIMQTHLHSKGIPAQSEATGKSASSDGAFHSRAENNVPKDSAAATRQRMSCSAVSPTSSHRSSSRESSVGSRCRPVDGRAGHGSTDRDTKQFGRERSRDSTSSEASSHLARAERASRRDQLKAGLSSRESSLDSIGRRQLSEARPEFDAASHLSRADSMSRSSRADTSSQASSSRDSSSESHHRTRIRNRMKSEVPQVVLSDRLDAHKLEKDGSTMGNKNRDVKNTFAGQDSQRTTATHAGRQLQNASSSSQESLEPQNMATTSRPQREQQPGISQRPRRKRRAPCRISDDQQGAGEKESSKHHRVDADESSVDGSSVAQSDDGEPQTVGAAPPDGVPKDAGSGSEEEDKTLRLVEEIWMDKKPGRPSERIRSNRIYVIEPARAGRLTCQDTRKVGQIVDEGGLACRQCQQHFTSVSNLRRHAIRHLGWRRFKCRLCRFCSYNRSECNTHILRAHPERLRASGSGGPRIDSFITDLNRQAASVRSNKKRRTLNSRRSEELNNIYLRPNSCKKTAGGKQWNDEKAMATETSPVARTSSAAESTPPQPTLRCCKSATPTSWEESHHTRMNIQRFNISTRNSPRKFDTRPYQEVDAMETLCTRKGFYTKPVPQMPAIKPAMPASLSQQMEQIEHAEEGQECVMSEMEQNTQEFSASVELEEAGRVEETDGIIEETVVLEVESEYVQDIECNAGGQVEMGTLQLLVSPEELPPVVETGAEITISSFSPSSEAFIVAPATEIEALMSMSVKPLLASSEASSQHGASDSVS